MKTKVSLTILSLSVVCIDTIDTSIRQRFNPCIFLGEYLMRNNPKHGTKLEYESLFMEWSVVEKLRRFFHLRR